MARALVERGVQTNYEKNNEQSNASPFTWREYKLEDTLHFHALRLYETGMGNSTPQKILAHGTDWRFLNELRKELKS